MAERVAAADSALFGNALRVVSRHLSTVSETFFVYNRWVGLASVAVLAVASPRLALSALFTSVLARGVAVRAGAARAFVDSGLVELNGWFLGLACGTFFAVGPTLAVALVAGGFLAAGVSIVMNRIVATWDIPLMVGPYVPAFWILSCALPAFPWFHAAVLPEPTFVPDSRALLVLLGGLRGLGEIFFLPDARVGLGLAISASIADWRLGPAMVGASVASVGVGFLAGAPMWQVQQGLAGFTPALVAVAALRRFSGLGPAAVIIAIVANPFLEAGALRLFGTVGLKRAVGDLRRPGVGLCADPTGTRRRRRARRLVDGIARATEREPLVAAGDCQSRRARALSGAKRPTMSKRDRFALVRIATAIAASGSAKPTQLNPPAWPKHRLEPRQP